MQGFTAIRDAIIAGIVAGFPNHLSASRVGADLDAVFDAILSEDADYGVVLDFIGAFKDPASPFKVPTWKWRFGGVFAIRYNPEDVEERLAGVLNILPKVFDADPRLGGITPLVEISNIGTPDPGAVNEVPLYWLPFSVSAYDR